MNRVITNKVSTFKVMLNKVSLLSTLVDDIKYVWKNYLTSDNNYYVTSDEMYYQVKDKK